MCANAFQAATKAREAMQGHRGQIGDRTDAQAAAVKKLYAEVEEAESGIAEIGQSCTQLERVLTFLTNAKKVTR